MKNVYTTFRTGIQSAVLGLALGHSFAVAGSFPDKPITVIVAASAGAGTDYVTRALTERLGIELGKPVVVENRGGAGGFVAADALRRSSNDGYTLLVAPDDVAKWPALGIHKSLNVAEDFEPVALLGTVDFFLIVSGSAATARTPLELVRLAKQSPGSLSYASPGAGSPQNLSMELFKQKTGTDFTHVPYKGMGPALTDLLAGRVQVAITGYPTFGAHLESGKIHVLAATSSHRSQQLPNVPTLAEQGGPDIDTQGYFSMFAPKGTPAPIIARLNAAINKVLAEPQVRDGLEKRAITPVGGPPSQLRDKIQVEIEKWKKVVKAAGITPDQ